MQLPSKDITYPSPAEMTSLLHQSAVLPTSEPLRMPVGRLPPLMQRAPPQSFAAVQQQTDLLPQCAWAWVPRHRSACCHGRTPGNSSTPLPFPQQAKCCLHQQDCGVKPPCGMACWTAKQLWQSFNDALVSVQGVYPSAERLARPCTCAGHREGVMHGCKSWKRAPACKGSHQTCSLHKVVAHPA